MKTSKLGPLLDELLAGQEAAPYCASSLEQMLAAAQRCQRRRRVRRLVAYAALPVALALACFVARFPGAALRLAANRPSPALVATTDTALATAEVTGGAVVRFISDDELLNLFPDRPVALVGAPGLQQLVFLDQRQ